MKVFHTEKECFLDITITDSINDERVNKYSIYKHYKNKLYLVIDIVYIKNELLVIYKPLYEHRYKVFARPLEMFIDFKKGIKRFEFICDLKYLINNDILFSYRIQDERNILITKESYNKEILLYDLKNMIDIQLYNIKNLSLNLKNYIILDKKKIDLTIFIKENIFNILTKEKFNKYIDNLNIENCEKIFWKNKMNDYEYIIILSIDKNGEPNTWYFRQKDFNYKIMNIEEFKKSYIK